MRVDHLVMRRRNLAAKVFVIGGQPIQAIQPRREERIEIDDIRRGQFEESGWIAVEARSRELLASAVLLPLIVSRHGNALIQRCKSFHRSVRHVSTIRQKFALLVSKGNFDDPRFARFQRLSGPIGRFSAVIAAAERLRRQRENTVSAGDAGPICDVAASPTSSSEWHLLFRHPECLPGGDTTVKLFCAQTVLQQNQRR